MKGMTKAFCKIVAVLLALLTGLCACGKSAIISVESAQLSTSSYSMSGKVYELSSSDGVTELRLYRIEYAGVEAQRVLEESAILDPQEFLALVNACKISRWDGFNKNDPLVLDGSSWSFTATVNGGETISASGSNAYPKGYTEFLVGLQTFLQGN